ncbi:MAG: 50S ribosomal protein L4 [Armatimonadetes bacterium]|nr:50S ribosomal protein L4 [Armatimonadota bacterium]
MAKLEVRGKDGKKVGTVDVSEAIAKAGAALLHRAVVSEEANSRQGTSATKGRAQVKGGGKKPYKQKKTGRARQGTIRAPHYTHGGHAHFLEPRDYSKKMNRKERQAAILGALAEKIESNDVVIAEKIAFAGPKTKDAAAFLNSLEVGEAKRVLVVLAEIDDVAYKCFRNMPNVVVRTAPAKVEEGKAAPKTAVFSTRDVLVAHKIVIAKDALSRIEEVWGK